MNEYELSARHEAMHAIAFILLGIRVLRTTISVDGGGHTEVILKPEQYGRAAIALHYPHAMEKGRYFCAERDVPTIVSDKRMMEYVGESDLRALNLVNSCDMNACLPRVQGALALYRSLSGDEIKDIMRRCGIRAP